MKRIIYFLVTALIAVSCSPPMYIPESVQVTSLTEKNELELAIVAGTNGFDFGAAYAITKNIGVQAKISGSNSNESETGDFLHRGFLDFGVGYTSFVGEEDSKLVLNCFGGAGFGRIESRQSYQAFLSSFITVNQSEGQYYKVWIQPSVAMHLTNFELIFATRVSFVEFNELTNYFQSNPYNINLVNGGLTNVFYEPSVTFRFGSKKLKGISQFGFSFAHNPVEEMQYRPQMFIANIGVMLNLGL